MRYQSILVEQNYMIIRMLSELLQKKNGETPSSTKQIVKNPDYQTKDVKYST